jgi:ABC-type sugar transport system permease subunit|tara:strand:- start:323 stop:1315 length:993 start_codon:yes stop_codon:yes gene_type:complete
LGLSQQDKASILWLLAPFFGLWIVFWLVPLILGIDLSLQSPTYLAPHRVAIESPVQESTQFSLDWNSPQKIIGEQSSQAKYIGLKNFSNVLEDAKFYKALRNTSIYVTGSILVIIPFAFTLSLCLFQLPRISRGLLVFCLMIPGLALPGVLSTLFYLFFHGRTGALNQYLVVPLGFDPVNWMMDPSFIMPSLIMQAVWRWTGMVTLFFLCGLEAIPRWQWEVAKVEGAGTWLTVRKILIPNLWHLALFAMVFLVVDGFASFSGAYNLLGGSGGILDSGLLLVTYVYQVAFPGGSGRFDFPGAAAMSLLVVPVTALILFVILQGRRSLIRR